MRLNLLIFILVVILLPDTSAGQSNAQYGLPLIQNFTAEDYDGHVQNWGFAQDSNGVLYLANLLSVRQYDGVNWNTIDLPNARVYSIKEAEDGIIYVGGIDEFGYLGPPKSDSTSTPMYYSLRHLISDSVDVDRIFNIASNDGKVYFQSSKSLIVYDGKTAQLFTSEKYYFNVIKREGSVLITGAVTGIQKVENDSLLTIEGAEFFAERSLFEHLVLQDKELFCTYEDCFIYEQGGFKSFPMEVDNYLITKYLDEAIVLQDGTIAMATRNGGVVHTDSDGNILEILDEENGLISNTVYGVYEDQNGSVWAATVNGVSKIDFGVPLRVFDERMGVKEGVNEITLFNNELALSTSGGVYFISEQKGQIRKIPFKESCGQFFDNEGVLYVICGSKLNRISENKMGFVANSLSAEKMAVYDEEKDLFFFGSELGYYLAKLDPIDQSLTVLYEINDLPLNPYSLIVDKEKNIWVGTSAFGVARLKLQWENERVVGHTIDHYLEDMVNESDDNRINVTRLDQEPAFLTWGKGIQRYDAEKGKMIQEKRYGSFFSDTSRQFFRAEEDPEGNVWFRSGGEYQAALVQEDGTYNTYEGVLKFIDHRQSNDIFADEKGFIWYATDRGAVRYQKDHVFNDAASFYTHINQVLVRNDSLINGGNSEKNTVLKYKDNELRFTYAAAFYFKPEETTYRIQLEGFDKNWSSWTTETQKDYTNIPEGNYRFKVQAKNVFGVVSEAGFFPFSVLPPWYRTWWAYLFYLICATGVIYIAYKIRINQLMRVQRIRNRIASDLHDEVSATLSSISYFAQAIQSDKVKEDKNRFVDLIAASAGDAKEKITDIVWAINPEHDDWDGFLSKCRRYASDLLESKDIKYSLKIDEHIPGKLDMQFRQHLWLIFKEMVTNAVRHSDATQLDVILRYDDNDLKLVVQDNGKGMDVDKVRKGNGLVNINKRADLIKGEVSLKTSEGFGTRWMLKIPL